MSKLHCPHCGYRSGWLRHMIAHIRIEHGITSTDKPDTRMRTKKYSAEQKHLIHTLAVLLVADAAKKVDELESCPILAPNLYALHNASGVIGCTTVKDAEKVITNLLSR